MRYYITFRCLIFVFPLFICSSVTQTTEMDSNIISALTKQVEELKTWQYVAQADIQQISSYIGVVGELMKRHIRMEENVDQVLEINHEMRALKGEIDVIKLQMQELENERSRLIQHSEMEQKMAKVTQTLCNVSTNMAELSETLQIKLNIDEMKDDIHSLKIKVLTLSQENETIKDAILMREIKGDVDIPINVSKSLSFQENKTLTSKLPEIHCKTECSKIQKNISDAITVFKNYVEVRMDAIEALHSADNITLTERSNIAEGFLQDSLNRLQRKWEQKYSDMNEEHAVKFARLSNNMSIYNQERVLSANANQRMSSLIQSLADKINTSASKSAVAFSARLTSTIQNAGDGQTIIFDNVVTNEGNCYDTRTGYFTAKRKGSYLFAVFSMGWRREWLVLELVQNRSVLGYVHSEGTDSSHGSGAGVFTAILNPEDVVWVRYGTSGIHRQILGTYTSFSGVLVTPM